MKKIISLILCAAMLVSLTACDSKKPESESSSKAETSATSSESKETTADNSKEEKPAESKTEAESSEEVSDNSSVIGTIVTFGKHNQKAKSDEKQPLEWIVIGTEGDNALVLSKYAIANMKQFKKVPAEGATWENSLIREFLNGDFYSGAFSDAEKAGIVETTNSNSCSKVPDATQNDTKDNVFLLSYDEAMQYAKDYFEAPATEEAYLGQGLYLYVYSDSDEHWLSWQGSAPYADENGNDFDMLGRIQDENNKNVCSWWLRGAGSDNERMPAILALASGDYGCKVSDSLKQHVQLENGVRPAMWVKKSALGL